MIEIRYLQAESGANKFGTCNCCGKSSSEDPLMISVKFSYYGHGTLIALCDDCKKKLMEALLPANTSEIPNSSDTISRQAAIDKIVETSDEIYKIKQKGTTYPHDDFFQGMAYAENIVKQLPPAQPAPHWIPVTERLPEYGEEVLTITKDNIYEVNHIIDEEYGEWFWEENGKIIAWMSLPAYKGVTE